MKGCPEIDGCPEFEDDLMSLVRCELTDAGRRRQIEEHVKGCESCRRSFEQQQSLSLVLARLRNVPPKPPEHLAAQLRAQFDTAHARRTMFWSPKLAVAAGIVLCCAAAYVAESRTHWRGFVASDSELAGASAAGSKASRDQVAAMQTATEADDFVPLPYAPLIGDHEHVDIYRVELSRNALRSFGLTSTPSHSGQVLTADIVVGDDGVARGIRVVR